MVQAPGGEVLIVGGAAASIGLYAVAWAVALGAGRVRYVDSDERRRRVAVGLGAEAEPGGPQWPRRFDRALIVVENTAQPDGMRCAIASTDGYCWCTSVALHLQPVEIPLLPAYTRGLNHHTSRADSRRYLPEVLHTWRVVGSILCGYRSRHWHGVMPRAHGWARRSNWCS